MSAVELLDKAIAIVDGLLAGAKPAQPAAVPAPAPVAPAAASGPAPAAPAAPAAPTAPAAKPAKPAKAPKPAAPKAAPAAGPAASDEETLFARALIKVGRILSVEELANSEKLYKLQVDVGGGETRQVCAGLRQFLPADALRERLVCVVANLKPAKLAGEASEAMVLAAEVETDGTLLVRTLVPPAGSAPGDVLFLSGGTPTASPDKVLKSDHWKKILVGLKVAGACAAFNGRALVTGAGSVTLPAEIPEGAEIH